MKEVSGKIPKQACLYRRQTGAGQAGSG